ncbi:unnamed protein product, partial [Porites evermanni]
HAGGRDKSLLQRNGCFGVEVGCNLKLGLGRKGRVFVLVFLKQQQCDLHWHYYGAPPTRALRARGAPLILQHIAFYHRNSDLHTLKDWYKARNTSRSIEFLSRISTCMFDGEMAILRVADTLSYYWTTWTECSQKCHIGTRTRSRTITQAATWGGDCPFHLSEIEVCGAVNCGCQHNCDPQTEHCSCLAGYTASGTLNTMH